MLMKPLVAQVIQPPALAIALTGGVDQGQVARLVESGRVRFGLRREIQLFQRDGDALGETGADKAAGGDGVAGTDQTHGFAGADDLAAFGNV